MRVSLLSSVCVSVTQHRGRSRCRHYLNRRTNYRTPKVRVLRWCDVLRSARASCAWIGTSRAPNVCAAWRPRHPCLSLHTTNLIIHQFSKRSLTPLVPATLRPEILGPTGESLAPTRIVLSLTQHSVCCRKYPRPRAAVAWTISFSTFRPDYISQGRAATAVKAPDELAGARPWLRSSPTKIPWLSGRRGWIQQTACSKDESHEAASVLKVSSVLRKISERGFSDIFYEGTQALAERVNVPTITKRIDGILPTLHNVQPIHFASYE